MRHKDHQNTDEKFVAEIENKNARNYFHLLYILFFYVKISLPKIVTITAKHIKVAFICKDKKYYFVKIVWLSSAKKDKIRDHNRII